MEPAGRGRGIHPKHSAFAFACHGSSSVGSGQVRSCDCAEPEVRCMFVGLDVVGSAGAGSGEVVVYLVMGDYAMVL